LAGEGDSIGFEFLERSSFLALDIDSDTSIVIEQEEGIRIQTFGGFGPGKHTAFFRRRSEDVGPGAYLKSIFVVDTNSLAKTPLADRSLLVIGDSYGVGYGNLSDKQSCTSQEIMELTDTRKSYGMLVGDSSNAEVSSVTYSGLGMVRNYAGNAVGTNASTYFMRDIIGDAESKHDFSKDSTDLIIIGLGTNDLSTPIKQGEQWSDIYELWEDWATTAHQMIDTLRTLQGVAAPILMITPPDRNPQRFIVNKVVEEQNAAGYDNVHYLELPTIKYGGCQWHPTMDEQILVANEIKRVVDSLGLWEGTALPVGEKVQHEAVVSILERPEILALHKEALLKFKGSIDGVESINKAQPAGAYLNEGRVELRY
jgi:hypothetical protein